MRSYNIAIFTSTPDLDYSMGTSPLRALKSIGRHNIISIDHKALYRLHGLNQTVRITREILYKNKVDIVLFGLDADYEFPIEYFSELRNHYFTVLHIGDDEHFFDKSSRYYSQAFDIAMTQSRLCMGRYELYGVDSILLPPAFDVSRVKDLLHEKIYDVCFVGAVANKVGRKEFLKYLVENEIGIEIFGSGTPGGVISLSEMNRIYGSSKIGLSFSGVATDSCLDRDIAINRRVKQTKVRAQEIALMKTFVLAEYVPGIEEFFDVGREIDIFHNRNELLHKVKYYLEYDSKREDMTARAFERAVHDCDEQYVWEKLLKEIGEKLDLKINERIEREDIIYKDPIFKRAFSSFHVIKFLDFVFRVKPKLAFDEFMIFMKYPLLDWGVFTHYLKSNVFRVLGEIKWLRSLVRKLKTLFFVCNGIFKSGN
jgi:spore maturation protein CgeB